MIEAPDSRNSLQPICMVNGLSAGNVGCPLRINAASPVRNRPGILIGPIPFVDDAREAPLAVTTSAAKFSKSDRESPDILEVREPPCVSSPTHNSGALLFTESMSRYEGFSSQRTIVHVVQGPQMGARYTLYIFRPL